MAWIIWQDCQSGRTAGTVTKGAGGKIFCSKALRKCSKRNQNSNFYSDTEPKVPRIIAHFIIKDVNLIRGLVAPLRKEKLLDE